MGELNNYLILLFIPHMFSSNRAIEKSGRLANYQYIYREEYAALSREYMRDVAWNGIFDKKKKKRKLPGCSREYRYGNAIEVRYLITSRVA